jgi:hypothetical protein
MSNRIDYIKEKIALWKMYLGGCLAITGSTLIKLNDMGFYAILVLLVVAFPTYFVHGKTTDLIELLNHDSGDIIP